MGGQKSSVWSGPFLPGDTSMLLRMIPGAVSFFSLLPYPKYLGFLGPVYLWLYRSYEAAVIEYHKERLCKLDPGFAFGEKSMELVRRREQASCDGIGPRDPRYPELSDVFDMKEL